MKFETLKEKHEAAITILRSNSKTDKERLDALHSRAREELSRARLTVDRKDAQVIATARELKKVAIREAVARLEQLPLSNNNSLSLSYSTQLS